MTSTIKVDTIQTAAGAVPTIGDLGINNTGTVLQTVTGRSTSNLTTTSTSFDTVTFANITPSTTSNAILINVNALVYKDNSTANSGGSALFTVSSNNVAIPEAEWTQESSTANYLYWLNTTSSLIYNMSRTYLHFPSSTSQQTIRFRVKTISGGQLIVYAGAQMILQEIAQ